MTENKKIAPWKIKYPTTKERVEYYSQRFPSVDRAKIAEIAEQFDKVAKPNSPNELEQDQVQLFFERRHETMTAQSIKKLFVAIDEDKDSRVNILEILSAIFKTDWKHLHAEGGDADKVDQLSELKLAALKLEAEKEAAKHEHHHLSEEAKKQHEEAEKKRKEKMQRRKKQHLKPPSPRREKKKKTKNMPRKRKKRQVSLKEEQKEELLCLIKPHLVHKTQQKIMLKESKEMPKNERLNKNLRKQHKLHPLMLLNLKKLLLKRLKKRLRLKDKLKKLKGNEKKSKKKQSLLLLQNS